MCEMRYATKCVVTWKDMRHETPLATVADAVIGRQTNASLQNSWLHPSGVTLTDVAACSLSSGQLLLEFLLLHLLIVKELFHIISRRKNVSSFLMRSSFHHAYQIAISLSSIYCGESAQSAAFISCACWCIKFKFYVNHTRRVPGEHCM